MEELNFHAFQLQFLLDAKKKKKINNNIMLLCKESN